MKPFRAIMIMILVGELIVGAVYYWPKIMGNRGTTTPSAVGKDKIKPHDDPYKQEKAKMLDYLRYFSAEDGARYYYDNYKSIPYLTELYEESIIPGLSNEKVLTLKRVYEKYIRNTPASAKYAEMYSSVKNSYMLEVRTDLNTLNNSLNRSFDNDFMPHLQQGIDSMVNADVNEVIEQAVGGFAEYRKFLPGKMDRAQKKWNEVMDAQKYIAFEQKFINGYTSQLSEFQSSYFEAVTQKKRACAVKSVDLSMALPFDDGIMLKIDDYVKDELSEMTKEMTRDLAVESAIEATTGGAATPLIILYNIGTFAYSIVDDMNNPSGRELLVTYCSNSVKDHIRRTSYESIKLSMRKLISESNDRLAREIDKELCL